MMDILSYVGATAAVVISLAVLWWMGRVLLRLYRMRAFFNALGAPAPAEGGSLYDDGDPGPLPAGKVALSVVQSKPSCTDCTNFDLLAGQKVLQANPAFGQVMAMREPWQEGWIRNPEHIKQEGRVVEIQHEITEFERQLEGTPAAEDQARLSFQASIRDSKHALAEAETVLAGISEYAKGGPLDPGVRKSMALNWGDFGLCAKKGELRARVDKCEDFERAELAP